MFEASVTLRNFVSCNHHDLMADSTMLHLAAVDDHIKLVPPTFDPAKHVIIIGGSYARPRA